MSSTPNPIPPRLDELMVQRATQGLAPLYAAELNAAIAKDPSLQVEAEAYELAATAIELALTKPSTAEALPQALREKLIADAKMHTQAGATAPALNLTGTAAQQAAQQAEPPEPTSFSFTDGRMFGWYAAIAALVALAVALLGPNTSTTPGPGNSADALPSYSELLTEPETITASWGFNSEAGDPRFANATGEVIWNSDKQAGYMKLAGLPINDPNQEQYQLWIVDPARDAEPIDGGVFNITAQGEVIVPIDAKLRAESPAVFAITIEQPGGVVVSEGPLQVVAAVEKES